MRKINTNLAEFDIRKAMKLANLKIKNFRSFGERSAQKKIRFKDGINLIVGENNVGKSTILRALELLCGPGDPSLYTNDWNAGIREKEVVIELEVELSNKELRTFLKPLIQGHFEDAKKVKRILQDLGRKICFIYSSKKGFLVKIRKLYIEGTSAKLTSDFAGSYTATTWNKTLQKYFESTDSSIFEIIDEQTKAEKGMRIDFGRNVKELVVNMLHQKLKIFSEVRKRPTGENKRILESYDGALVADVLTTLKMGNRRERERFGLIQRKFRELFSSLKLDVTKESPDKAPKIVIEKTPIDYEVPIEFVGAGIGEMVIFLTHLIASEEMIFGLDMPELHFHPHSQRLLLGILKEYSQNNQILIVTHSPLFLEPEEIDNMIIVREDKGETIVTQLPENYFDKEEKIRLQRHLDTYNREFFFSRASLIVEGETEVGAMPIFSKALDKDFDRYGISIIRTGKHFGIFIKLLKGLTFPYFVMCDKDALMNIEESIDVNGQRVKTSPVFYNLSKIDLLQGKHAKRISEIESKTSSIDSKEMYHEEQFNELNALAKTYDIYVLPSDFEGVLRKRGYENLLKEAESISDSKVTRGRYVAEKVIRDNLEVPEEFQDVIDAIMARVMQRAEK